MKWLCSLLLVFCTSLQAQNISLSKQKFIFFPRSPQKKWKTSIGFTATTMPYEITEELHFRVPAGDFHVLRRLNEQLYLDSRLNFQFLQNLVTLGPRWVKPLNDRVSLSLGNDLGFWFGFIRTEGIRTHGSGWQNYPNLSVGYRFNKAILLTVKGESIMNFGIRTYAGPVPVTTSYSLFSGSAYTVALEQPFYGKKSLTLGFRAIYTNFYWQTWTLFNPYDRNLFFPQVIVGIIL
ncbi:MAG: hypothetical protein ACXVMS_09990 [Flavisolibacter sp.]